ncbi:MAG: diguanylate cyclase, partial [Candidatus Brocadiae bacterium]|nr:diguanylate cyclase [Candidatus Brocadiia bacterium]
AEAAATVDAATGLASRRLFDDVIGRELKRARRTERPIALAVAEIDYFDRYESSFGRQAAEGLLQAIAKLFTAQVRDTDLLVRFAPGRLAILMPETDMDKGAEIAEWIRSMVANSPLPNRAEMPGGRITVSIGVGAFPAPVADAAAFLGAVEAALAAAATERNRMRAAQ